MATSDDDGDDTHVSKLNASINGWKGVTLTLFDAMRMIGNAFGVIGEVQAALDASASVVPAPLRFILFHIFFFSSYSTFHWRVRSS